MHSDDDYTIFELSFGNITDTLTVFDVDWKTRQKKKEMRKGIQKMCIKNSPFWA